MKAQEFKKIIREEVKNVLKEETVKLGSDKSFILKSDKKGVQLTKVDPNDGFRIHSQMYIFKQEIADVVAFLTKNK